MIYKLFFTFWTVFTLSITNVKAAGNEPDADKQNSHAVIPGPSLSINSSSYNTAVGIRGMGTTGLTIKHFTQKGRAIEGIIGLWPNAFSATALLEFHVNAFSEPGLNWYYGVGGHIAAESNWEYYDGIRGYRSDEGMAVGVDGIFGIEYKIREVPIAVSLDVKPFIEVTTGGKAFLAMDPGLGVKLTF